MRLDLTLVLYWASLGISAALVVLFLWLMREPRKPPASTSDPSPESRVPSPGSRP